MRRIPICLRSAFFVVQSILAGELLQQQCVLYCNITCGRLGGRRLFRCHSQLSTVSLADRQTAVSPAHVWACVRVRACACARVCVRACCVSGACVDGVDRQQACVAHNPALLVLNAYNQS